VEKLEAVLFVLELATVDRLTARAVATGEVATWTRELRVRDLVEQEGRPKSGRPHLGRQSL
jgi:hypothetical protein